MTERARDAVFVALVLVSAATLTAVLWAWGLPLGNDGATHVFQAYVTSHLDDPDTRYRAFYELLAPRTALVFGDVQSALEPLVGWQAAWRLNVLLAAQLTAFGFLAFIVALAPARRFVGLLGFPMALQAALWLGLMPFYYAVGLAWLCLAQAALIARGEAAPSAAAAPPAGARWVLLGVTLTLTARAHVVPAALVGVILATVLVASARRGRVAPVLLKVALVGAPAAWIAITSRGAEALGDGELTWLPVLDRVSIAGVGFQSGPRWREWFATLLTFVGLAAWLARWRRGQLDAAERVFGAAGFLCLTISIAAPLDAGSWQLAGIRAVPLAVGLCVAFLPFNHVRARAIVSVFVLTYAGASFAWAWSLHRALRAATEPALAGLVLPREPVERISFIPVDPVASIEPPVVRFAPLIHLSNLYSITRGGMDPYGHHGVPSKHRIALKPGWKELAPPVDTWPPLWNLEGDARAGAMRRSLSRLTSFRELVLFGRPDDVDQALEAGWVPRFVAGGLLVGVFEGCRGVITLTGATEPLEIEVGWWPARTPTAAFHWQPGVDAPTSFPIEGIGCGEVWMHVTSPRGARCAEVSDDLPVRARFERGAANVLACQVTTAGLR